MRKVSSGFADVNVFYPDDVSLEFQRIRERFQIDANTMNESIPIFMYEGEIFIERENTLFGMYYQREEDQYAQLIRCGNGSAFLGIVDIRYASKTYRKSKLFFISAENGMSVYIPRGFAVGYMSVSENTLLVIKMEKKYDYEKELILNPFEKVLNIKWPCDQVFISAKERYAPGFSEVERGIFEKKVRELLVATDTLEIVDGGEGDEG